MNQGQLNELTTRLDKLIESETTMKDEMYIALRSYLEEHSSLLRQILEEVKGSKTPVNVSKPSVYVPPEAVGPVTVETKQPSGATIVQTVDSGNEAKAAATTKGKPSAKPTSSWGG